MWHKRSAPRRSQGEESTKKAQDFCIEAAMRLIENQEAVTKFCCRAAGKDVGSWARGNPTKCRWARMTPS